MRSSCVYIQLIKPQIVTTSHNLKLALYRRLQKDPNYQSATIDNGKIGELFANIILDLCEQSVLDDAAFAKIRIASLLKKGMPLYMIKQDLQIKGVANDIIENLFSDIQNSQEDIELQSAHIFAQRRRLGPYRQKNIENAEQRDIASLLRKGFSFDIVQKLMKGED